MGLKYGLNVCTNAEYHADTQFLSSSSYKLILDDLPRFHKEKILGIKEDDGDKPYFVEGSYTHTLILEPEMLDKEYAVYPGKMRAGNKWLEFKEENSNKQIITAPQVERCLAYEEAYNELANKINLIQRGEAEQTICGVYSGIDTKVRFDYINVDEGYIVDVKTSSSPVDRDNFMQTMTRYKYDLSAALYLALAEDYYGKPFDFYFACIGKKEGRAELFKLSKASRQRGEAMLAKAVLIYKKCLTSGNWDVNVDIDYNILEV